MDKSVLVIETPENCYDCPIGQDCSNILETSLFCLGAGKCVIDKEAATIPNWCPLKPLPERHIAPKTATGYEIGYEDGWKITTIKCRVCLSHRDTCYKQYCK